MLAGFCFILQEFLELHSLVWEAGAVNFRVVRKRFSPRFLEPGDLRKCPRSLQREEGCASLLPEVSALGSSFSINYENWLYVSFGLKTDSNPSYTL